MGKRNRKSTNEVDEKQKLCEEKCLEKIKDDADIKLKKKIRKKIKKEIPDMTQDKVESDTKTNLQYKELESDISVIDKPNKVSLNEDKKVKKSKKAVFIDDVPHAVASTHGHTSKQNALQNEFDNEETVKDEDIDKFCDELSPADNEQFETWVKMIEAKLHSKK